MSWRKLRVIIEHLPETSALYRARNPDTSHWGLSEQLLAAAVDAMHVANWLQSKDGAKNRNRPAPLERPGVTDARKTTHGVTRMSFAEADAWLAGEGVAYQDTKNDLMT